MVGKTPHNYDHEKVQKMTYMTVNWNFFEAFGNFIFAFNCHLNVVPVASELENPTPPRIRKVI